MKYWTVSLAVLCLLVGALPGLAQAPQTIAKSPAAAPAADFLASLSTVPAFLPDTSCTTNAQCPPGQLCCRACGTPDCTAKACFVPMNGHCPLIP